MAVRDVLKRQDFQFSVGRYRGIPCFEMGQYSTELADLPGRVLARFLSCIRGSSLSLDCLPAYLKCDPFVDYFLFLLGKYDGVIYESKFGSAAKAVIICESVNQLLADLRAYCGEDHVISARKNFQRLSNLNADSTHGFLCDVCGAIERVRIARLNLYPAIGGARSFDPKAGVAAFKQFLKTAIAPGGKNLAYLWHLGYAASGDIYFHLALIMQVQAEQNWEQEAKVIGDLWLGESQEGVRGYAFCKDRILTRRINKEGEAEKVQTAYPTFQSIGTGDHLTSDEAFRKKLKAIAVSLTQQERFFRFIEPESVQQGDIGPNGEEPPVTKKKGKRSYVVLGRKKLV